MSVTLKKLSPVKFPLPEGQKGSTVYTIESTKGKPTREIVAEMKRLSKQDLFPTAK